MRLPHRTPWASICELELLCSWIYTDENDYDAKVLAINRLSAWKAITSLPHALESALSLLVVIAHDRPQAIPISQLSLRQSYSAAVIRLVNGLVDPLQHGAYARPIASIASQLGLPSWLVELRHAATHEDLPSVGLLRQAARESMVWLLHNYFLPMINPSTTVQSETTLRPLEPILKQYKSLMKITTRDASLRTQYKPNILLIMKDVERWIAEVRVAANMATTGLGWEVNALESSLHAGEMDGKEKRALEHLCDVLMEKGGLVPLSKKKRELLGEPFSPPKFSIQLWAPLLQHLQSTHTDFYVILAQRIVYYLLPEEGISDTRREKSDPSYDMCLARWALWSIEAWEGLEYQYDVDLRKDVIFTLLQSLGHDSQHGSKKSAIALLEILSPGYPQLQTALATLKELSNNVTPSDWKPEDMATMNHRLDTLLSDNTSASLPSQCGSPLAIANRSSEVAPGWYLLQDTNGWKPCPIGIHCTIG